MGLFSSKKKKSSFIEKVNNLKIENEKQRKIDDYTYDLVSRGQQCEKCNDTTGAIKYYEELVSMAFKGSHPYKRLAIIYRKQKKYEDEIRVIREYRNAVSPRVFDTCEESKFIWFRDHLEKAILLSKSNN